MARFNEILVGRLNRALQKYTSIKGGPPAAQLASEIGAQINFNQMGADFRYLEGWNRFALLNNPAAVAGINCASRLRNPAGSNVIAVIERCIFNTPAADQPQLQQQQTNADLSVIAFSPQMRLDPRGNPQSVLINSISAAGLGTGLLQKLQGFIPANSFFDFIIDTIHELPLLPGDAYQAQSNAANTACNIAWLWRERFLEDSERT
jgi:hypothetical protein